MNFVSSIWKIYSCGYERFAMVEEIGKNVKINVHFLEHDEYLEYSETSGKKKKVYQLNW